MSEETRELLCVLGGLIGAGLLLIYGALSVWARRGDGTDAAEREAARRDLRPDIAIGLPLLAVLGMMTETAGITLAVHYRDIDDDGRIRGGPMYYIRKGLGWPALATVFSLGIFVNSLFSASLLQAHTVGRAFLQSYGFSPSSTPRRRRA